MLGLINTINRLCMMASQDLGSDSVNMAKLDEGAFICQGQLKTQRKIIVKLKVSYFVFLLLGTITTAYADEPSFSHYEGQEYQVVKSDLLTQGWKLLPTQDEETPIDKNYPEITCGSGSMAICSVGFQNGQNTVAFIVEKSGSQLIVLGEY